MQEKVNQQIQVQFGEAVQAWQPVSGGMNNRGFVLQGQSHRWFAKHYYFDQEGCNRFRRETEFAQVMQGVTQIPQLHFCDAEEQVAVFQHIEGTPPTEVNQPQFNAALRFLSAINQAERQQKGKRLQAARGGMASPADFLEDIERRIGQLLAIDPQHADNTIQDANNTMLAFVTQSLVPLQQTLQERVAQSQWQPFSKLLSPSDVGYHNSLEAEHLYFFDFEYAGWDSGEKLITDYFCQPRYQPDIGWLPELTQALAPLSQNPISDSALQQHCHVLMPLAALKWVLIFLNEFKLADQQRRAFSAGDETQTGESQLLAQLNKAQQKYQQAIYFRDTLRL